MNEIEKTIRVLSDMKLSFSQNYIQEAFDVSIEALREQVEREKGCEYCKVLTPEHCTGFMLPSSDPDAECDMVTITHCPMCGKRLEVEQG